MEIAFVVMKRTEKGAETIAILRDRYFAIELCKAIENSRVVLSINGYKTVIYSNNY